jgi:hypothetical protein
MSRDILALSNIVKLFEFNVILESKSDKSFVKPDILILDIELSTNDELVNGNLFSSIICLNIYIF